MVGVCEQGCGVGEVCDEPWSPEGADLGRLDLNGDGEVNGADLGRMLISWGQCQ